MKILISNQSEKPIYEQVYEQAVAQIVNGELPPNLMLPSIRTVAKELGISIITVKKAWETLEHNGFIYTRAGKGCFVADTVGQVPGDRRLFLARERLGKDLTYYQNLNITLDELLALIREEYKR